MRSEVAEQYELTGGVTSVHVASLGRDYDLTRISLAEAADIVAAGCTRLRRKPAPLAPAEPAVVPVADPAPPAPVAAKPARNKRGAAGANRQPR